MELRERDGKMDFEELFRLLIEWRDDPAGGDGVHCNAKQTEVYKGRKLGFWLTQQRRPLRDEARGTRSGQALTVSPKQRLRRTE